MWLKQFALLDDVGSRGAQVGSRSVVFSIAAEQLDFNRCRELLVLVHLLRGFAVNHDAAVAYRPAGSARRLISNKTVFHAKIVARKGILIEQVANGPGRSFSS